jgi:hypothetical protein
VSKVSKLTAENSRNLGMKAQKLTLSLSKPEPNITGIAASHSNTLGVGNTNHP